MLDYIKLKDRSHIHGYTYHNFKQLGRLLGFVFHLVCYCMLLVVKPSSLLQVSTQINNHNPATLRSAEIIT